MGRNPDNPLKRSYILREKYCLEKTNQRGWDENDFKDMVRCPFIKSSASSMRNDP